MTFAERIVAEMLDEPADSADITPGELVRGYEAGQKVGGHPLGLLPPNVDEDQILRVVKVLGKYTLALWDTYERDSHRTLGYRFSGPSGRVLFQGQDYHVPGHHALDSNETVQGLLGWFVLKPGDTDDEYFKDYTPEQLEFAESDDAERINDYTVEDSDVSAIIRDVPGFEHGDPVEDEE